MPFLLLYWRQVLMAIGAAILSAIIWWFGFHIPSQLSKVEAERDAALIEVDKAQRAFQLVDDIQKGKAKVDAYTFKRISTLRSVPVPHRKQLINGGMPLPPMR